MGTKPTSDTERDLVKMQIHNITTKVYPGYNTLKTKHIEMKTFDFHQKQEENNNK